jgi:putative SOS response-associated peptidase YedK
MSGYFEWQTVGKEKLPWYFTAANSGLLTAAGLWDEWKNRETGETIVSCTMLITQPTTSSLKSTTECRCC